MRKGSIDKENAGTLIKRSRSEVRHHYNKDTLERDTRTAQDKIRRKKISELKISSRHVAPQQLRHIPPLHQSIQSACDGSIIIFPKTIQENDGQKQIKDMKGSGAHQIRGFYNGSLIKKDHLSHGGTFSRKSIQEQNSRLRKMRSSNYGINQRQNMEDSENSQGNKLRVKAASFLTRMPQIKMSPFKLIEKREEHEVGLPIDNQFLQNLKFREKMQKKREKQCQVIPGRSQSVVGNEFFTRLKKKSLQNDPHLLATIIKHKSQVSAKEELYQFVTKIISRSRKN